MPKHLVPVMSLLAAVILLVMLNFTTPAGVGPFGVLVFFTTFYILMFGVALALVRFFARLTRSQLWGGSGVWADYVDVGTIDGVDELVDGGVDGYIRTVGVLFGK